MSPTFNGSFALQRFERDNAINIRNRIMFDFYPGLPHILFQEHLKVLGKGRLSRTLTKSVGWLWLGAV